MNGIGLSDLWACAYASQFVRCTFFWFSARDQQITVMVNLLPIKLLDVSRAALNCKSSRLALKRYNC